MRPRHLIGATGLGLSLALVAPAAPSPAYPDAPSVAAFDGACEGDLLRLHNQARADAGLPALKEDARFDQVARGWTARIVAGGNLAHNPSYVSQIKANVMGLTRASENVGRASSANQMNSAFMGSPGHRGNILDRTVQRIAIGCMRDRNGRYWATVNFAGSTQAIADRRPAPFRSMGDASARLRWWLLAEGPDAGQLERDATELATDWSAADLAVYLAESSAHEALVPGTVRLYGAAFDRHPDASGLNYWVQQRQQGMSLTSMASRFISSGEFQNLYGRLPDRDYVAQIYRNVLHREPDTTGLDYWTGRLRAGDTRGDVLVGFSESGENKRATASAVTVSWAFAQVVARMPTGAERSQWEARLNSGGTAEALVRSLVASDAFARRGAAGSY